ncbi:hypothetical protein DITRI_Ditri12bG0057000 [Diplodiscus trichospermus]
MANAGDKVADAVLTAIVIGGPPRADVTVEQFREVLAELDREKQAREAAENWNFAFQVLYKVIALAQEAIRKLDEYARQRDEALREKEEALKSKENALAQLAEANKITEEVTKQKEDLAKLLEEMIKIKDGSGSEAETILICLFPVSEKGSRKSQQHQELYCCSRAGSKVFRALGGNPK